VRPSDLLPGFNEVQAFYVDLLCAGVGSQQDARDHGEREKRYRDALNAQIRGMR
jgi:hypothetical protein